MNTFYFNIINNSLIKYLIDIFLQKLFCLDIFYMED